MRPPFKNGGGKKGMRQVTGKHQKKIILRPAPAPTVNANTTSSKGKERQLEQEEGEEEDYDQEEGEDQDDTEQYGYRESLQQDRLPLAGLSISVSGCRGQKEDLLKIAQEYGAERHSGLQDNTTHLVTDRPEGAKYKIALERRMTIMTPEWLPAVREAWTSGDQVDFDQLESDHRLLPLTGVIFTLTHFAQGAYKEDYKMLLMNAGAEYTTRLDTSCTHLIVASPSSPHSQTPASTKLLHGTRNPQCLAPDFKVVWEGWAREAIKFGGRREERDQVWIWQEGKNEQPEEDLNWTVDEPPRRTFDATPRASTSTGAVPQPIRKFSQTSRDLTGGRGGGGRANAIRKFTGYDNSLTETVEGQSRRPAAAADHDLANGKILKKRRRTTTTPDSSQGNPEQLFDVFGQISILNNAPIRQPLAQIIEEQSPDNDDNDFDLPVPPPGFEDADMVFEMREGEVGLQRTKKSKSAIKAITSSRIIAEVESQPKSIAQLRSMNQHQQHEVENRDDSGFLDNTEVSNKEDQMPSSSGASIDSTNPNIFVGLTLAVMGIKAQNPQVVAGYIEKGGGRAIIDASDEEIEQVDWIVVDFVEPPQRFANASDPRIVSVCWIEYCLWAEEVVPIIDRVLDRPIPFPCPVKGAEKLLVHFSGWGWRDEEEDKTPDRKHIERFLHVVGVKISPALTRSCTHLILYDLEENPDLNPEEIDGNENRKVQKAREWAMSIVSFKEFRKIVARLAGLKEEDETNKVKKDFKGKGKQRECGKEITNEQRNDGGEESMRNGGPLEDCVVYFSTKSNFDRQSLANIVKDLGGTAARQYSDSITHFIYSDPSKSSSANTTSTTTTTKKLGSNKVTESYKDLKLAKLNPNCQIVHPRWVEECGKSNSRVSELDFPSTFDSRKGGQLFDAGMSMAPSPPRLSPPSFNNDVTARSDSNEGRSGGGGIDSRKSTPLSSRKKSQLDFQIEQEGEEVDNHDLLVPSRSPTPRRRRSDSTRTEIVEEEEAEDINQAQQQPLIAAGPLNASSSSRPTNITDSSAISPPHHDDEEEDDDDHSTLRALSEIPPRQTDEDSIEQRQLEAKKKKEELLKLRTEALREAMQPDLNNNRSNLRTKSNVFGKKQQSIPYISPPKKKKSLNSPTRTTSLPTLLPSSSPSHDNDDEEGHENPSRGGGGGEVSADHHHHHQSLLQSLPPSSSIQYTQSQIFTSNQRDHHDHHQQHEVRVIFDEPQAIQARERILKRQREQEDEKKRFEQEQRRDLESQGRRITRSAKKGM